MEKNERVYYYDIIRVIGCLCILTIHFNASFSGWSGGMFLYPNSVLPYYLFNHSVYLGDFGVSLFFMLSGASMFRAYGNREVSLAKFYKKRFFSLYPMFWISWFASMGVFVLVYGGMAPGGLRSAIATVLGMDGYMMSFGYTSFSIFYQVGEWYLGCIVLLYLLMPLLIWGVKQHPVITAAASLLIFMLLYQRVPDHFFLLRIPEVVFGMLFDCYFRPQKGKRLMFSIAGVVLGIALLSATGQRVTASGYALVLCILISALFYAFVILVFQNVRDFRPAGLVSALAKYTYPAFLIHHQVCEYMARRFYLPELPQKTLLFTFLVYLAIVAALSILLDRANRRILQCCSLNRNREQTSA